MSGELAYAIIQVSDDRRGERLNAGLVVFTPSGLDVRLPRRLEKLRAMSNALNFDSVRRSIESLVEHDQFARESGVIDFEERLERLRANSPFSFTPSSAFAAHSADAYENLAKQLLTIFVEPEPALPTKRSRRTKLTSSIRKLFSERRILARSGESLEAHRVVTNVPIVDGLSADFVLRNGAMHVIETVDASSDVISLRKAVSEIAVAALVLEQARMTYGEKKTLSKLVYDASPSVEKLATPSLEAAAHQGAKLVNWASHDDRKSFLDRLTSLAEPLPGGGPNNFSGIHASNQQQLKLN